MNTFLAVDIGASSGRHILGWLDNGRICLEEVYRFENRHSLKNGYLCWDADMLFASIINGLKRCKELGYTPQAVGVDTWGVDYVLLDENDQPLGDCVCYRDGRTEGMDAELEKRMSYAELYRRTGIAKQPFNTVYQLMAHFAKHPEHRQSAQSFLMMPEYLSFLLTGCKRNEYSIASTTAMLDAQKRDWDTDVLRAAGIPERLFTQAPAEPGTVLGRLKPELAKEIGFDCTVILPAMHDTGSAFAAVPARDDNAVYLSSGTWSLLGVENAQPLCDDKSRELGFTNEGGYGGCIRYLKNIMGLWILQCMRREGGEKHTFAEMAQLAGSALAYPGRFDANDASLLSPDNMTQAVKKLLVKSGAPQPQTEAELLSAVYHSLAQCYASAVKELETLTGKTFTSLNIVGGGSQNAVLDQLTADAVGLPVYAGPAEGTALGNLLVQMIAENEISDLQSARDMVRTSLDVTTYLPQNKEEKA